MDMKRFFLYAIVIAALALAGCGGNGGTKTVTPVDPPSCPSGQVGTPPNCVTPGPSVADLFETAQNARDAAEDAVKTAMDSVDDAEKYSAMINADKVRGDSMMAQANAQKVLDAQTAVTGAVTAAETAVSELTQADKDADKHNNDALDNAIAAAMKVAEQAVKDAKTQAGRSDLETFVANVTGTDKKKPITAADRGTMVAEAVGGALAADSPTDGSGERVVFQVSIDPNETVTTETDYRPEGEAKYEMNDHQGMTWEQIVGSGNVMDKRVSTSETSTKIVKASSVSGMTLTTGDLSAATEVATGTQHGTLERTSSILYEGIPGMVFCQGADCKIESVTTGENATTKKKLTGSWYFTPGEPKEWYLRPSGTMTYVRETQYARYGYWVRRDAANGNVTVNVYAIPGSGAQTTTNFDLDVQRDGSSSTLTDTSAKYSGQAIGLSLYKEFQTDGTVADGFPQTGEFMADVELTAGFGQTATLDGKITNFRGNAVDSNWSVTLSRDDAAFDGSLEEANAAPASGGGSQNGIWTATAYGSSNTARPEGIFGHFNTHFTNGHAAGAYATRKKD